MCKSPLGYANIGGEVTSGPFPGEGRKVLWPSATGCPHAHLSQAWDGDYSQSLLRAVTFPGWNRKSPGLDRK